MREWSRAARAIWFAARERYRNRESPPQER